ncbi:MAG: hypothetical protein ABI457_11355, partial [Hyphomicrobium sp.]
MLGGGVVGRQTDVEHETLATRGFRVKCCGIVASGHGQRPEQGDGMREDEVAATPDKSTGAARVEDQVATQKGSGTAPHDSEPVPEPMIPPAQDAPAQASAPPAPPAASQPVQISCTRGFPDWLLRNNVSLAFTSYQTGRLYLVGVNAQGQTA